MNSTVVQYSIFILAALVLIWAVILLNRRLWRHGGSDVRTFKTWVEFDARRPEAREDPVPLLGDEEEEEAEQHLRARQNGHHAESQKPQI
jgi:hypothetical protein